MLLPAPPSGPCGSDEYTWDLGAGPALPAGSESGGDVIVVPVTVPNPEDFRNNVELQLEYLIGEDIARLRDLEMDMCLEEVGRYETLPGFPPGIIYAPCRNSSVRYKSTRLDRDTLDLTHKSVALRSETPLMSLVCLLCTPEFSQPCHCSTASATNYGVRNQAATSFWIHYSRCNPQIAAAFTLFLSLPLRTPFGCLTRDHSALSVSGSAMSATSRWHCARLFGPDLLCKP
jgi:hypothetical protein